MKKYVKKPIPIHAFRWDGYLLTLKRNVTKSNIKKYFITLGLSNTTPKSVNIKSLEGVENCQIGDYIIRGIHGEYYPCDPKIFKESYKEVK